MTTSVPEAPGSGRNWDYRFCWLRDAYFVVRAANRLGATDTMERYLQYITNLVALAPDGHLQPVYGIRLQRRLDERVGRPRCAAIAAWARCGSATRPTSRCRTTPTAA